MNVNNLTVQDLQFEIIKRSTAFMASRHEDFPNEIVELFKANPHLWEGVILSTEFLTCLRDINHNDWNGTSILILCVHGKEDALYKLCESLLPSDIRWMDKDKASLKLGSSIYSGRNKIVLELWWD